MLIVIAVLGVVTMLGLIPVRFNAQYDGNGFSIMLKVLFFKMKFPCEVKKSLSENGFSDKKKDEKKERNQGSMKRLTAIIEPAFKTLGKLARMLCVRKLVVNLTFASDDAFSTAMMYGGAAVGIGAIFPFIDNNLKIKKKYISINADFESIETTVYLQANISILIGQVVVLAFYFLCQFLIKISTAKKERT